MVAESADNTSLIHKFNLVGSSLFYTIYAGVTVSLQSKRADNLAVNQSTEETTCASGRLLCYLYLPCSAGDGERARVTNHILN